MSHCALIERVVSFVCRRNHLQPSDADDFKSHVTLELLEDDYAILRKFEGRSSLHTYLSIVIQRLFLDYRIAAWGKWRPSAEARRLGPVASLLEQLMTRDGYSFEEAYELMRTNHGVTMARVELEQVVARLPVRTVRRFESEDRLVDVPARSPSVDHLVVDAESQEAARRVSAALKSALARFEVQDRLILTLRFEDGRTVAEIASTLKLDQKALYRRLERLLRDLRTALESAGIERATVLEMLESPAVSIEWKSGGDGPRETLMTRPSMTGGAR